MELDVDNLPWEKCHHVIPDHDGDILEWGHHGDTFGAVLNQEFQSLKTVDGRFIPEQEARELWALKTWANNSSVQWHGQQPILGMEMFHEIMETKEENANLKRQVEVLRNTLMDYASWKSGTSAKAALEKADAIAKELEE